MLRILLQKVVADAASQVFQQAVSPSYSSFSHYRQVFLITAWNPVVLKSCRGSYTGKWISLVRDCYYQDLSSSFLLYKRQPMAEHGLLLSW